MTLGRGHGLRRRLARLLMTAACAVATGACGQWSGVPARQAAPAPIPLGPGTPVRVASDPHVRSLEAASWRRRVVLAWTSIGTLGPVVRLAVSRDAGASFDTPREVALGPVEGGPAGTPVSLRVSPVGRGASPDDEALVWLRVTSPKATARVWRSTDGGRTFAEFAGAPPTGTFDEQWQTESGQDGVRVVPPSALKVAGPRTVEPPAGASGDRPVAVLDEHGALALAWLEGGESVEGTELTLRRLWVDWSSASAGVTPFDAPIVVARSLSPGTPVAMVDVPGGVLLAWRGREGESSNVDARRVGLDMTCTSEQAGAAIGHGPPTRR